MRSAAAKIWTTCLPICVAVGLAGCIGDPAKPAMSIVAAETSRDDAGTIHVSALVQNGGANEGVSDFDGSFCAKAVWLAGTSTSLDADDAGAEQVIATGSACGSSLTAGNTTRLDVVPDAPITGPAFIRVTLDVDDSDTAHIVTSPP